MLDERAFLRRVSSASPVELAQVMADATAEEQRLLKLQLGAQLYDELRSVAERTVTRAAAPKLGNIIVLHGIMGGELTLFNNDGQVSIWMNAIRLVQGQFDRLVLDEDTGLSTRDVRATGMYMRYYARQLLTLSENWEVRPFFFDWRRDIRIAADDLRNSIDSWFGRDSHVHLIAHSMGGLVARSFIVRHRDRWDTMLDPDGGKRGGRLVMLGTPNHGSFAIPRLLFGNNDVLDILSKLNIAHFGNIDIPLQCIRTFRGVYQMMPVRTKLPGLDVLYRASTYTRTTVRQTYLDQAEAFQNEVANTADATRMVYVAGYNRVTAGGIRDANQLGTDAGYTFTRRGDGTVPHVLGLLDGVKTFFVDEEHGKLPQNERVLRATTELLQTGGLRAESDLFFGLSSDVRGQEEESQIELRQDEETRRSIKMTQAEQLRDSLSTRAGVNGDAVTPEEQAVIDLLLGHDPVQHVPASTPPAPEVTPSDSASAEALPVGEPITLKVSVSHGDLRQAKYPVAVGHYYGDVIVSAEKVLDNRIGGRLSHRFQLGIYPGADGTSEYIEAPDSHPNGALVVGLGDVGQLTVEKLRRAVTQALLDYAARKADKPSTVSGEWQPLGFSSVLLGTYGGEALNIRDSVKAIIDGAIEANRTLQICNLWPLVRIVELEIIELYEDQAIQATYEAISVANRLNKAASIRVDIQADPEMHVREGGKFHRPNNQYESGWWRRIKITQSSENSLSYEVLTDRARSESSIRATQKKFVDRYVAEAIHSARYQENLGSTLFELLLPVQLKEQARNRSPIVLVLDPNSAQYPWELMADRTPDGIQPLATSMGLLRQFTATEYRQSPRAATELQALVVGDTQSGLMELKGAQEEATVVAGVLQTAQYAVKSLIRSDALTIGDAFFEKNYKVMHIAAHGVYNPNYTQSGVVIGPDLFLTPAEFSQLRVVPDLVFINCCHLGQIDGQDVLGQRSPYKLAASVSLALIESGVKAVIAAGWAVNDKAASNFAQVFYQQMLVEGSTFGEAVREARIDTWSKYRQTNTWGAYQCYGNPQFRLSFLGGSETSKPGQRTFVGRREYMDRVRNIVASAHAGRTDSDMTLLAELDALRKQIPVRWLDGEMLAAFAEAYGELNSFANAIEIYRDAMTHPSAKASIAAAQQYANLMVRHAMTLPENSKQQIELTREAQKWTTWLSELVDTPEQLGFVGGLHRRLAVLSNAEQRQLELIRSRDAYRQAHKKKEESTNALDPYFALNAASIGFVIGDENTAELLTLIDRSKEIAEAKAESDRDFWSRVGVADAAFARHLIDGTLQENTESLAAAYLNAFAGGSSSRERSSVFDHLRFFERIQPDTEQGKTVRDALHRIQDRIGCSG